jgi:secreted trypsin-like serine protease
MQKKTCLDRNLIHVCAQGDGGGPLFFMDTSDKKFTLLGVISFYSSTSCTNFPAGHSRVTSYLGWISGKTGILIRR